MDLLAVYHPDSYVLLMGENNSLCITKLRCTIILTSKKIEKGTENGYDETRRSQKTEVKSIV